MLLISTTQEVASTSKMSSGSGNTESGSSGVQPGKGDDETLPKLKLAQLASIPDQGKSLNDVMST